MRFQLPVALLSLTGLLGLAPVTAESPAGEQAADRSAAAQLLPATTIAYLELSNPAELVADLMAHPARLWLERQDDYREALEEKQYLQFKAVVAVVEAQLGQTWPKILAAAAGDGAYLAFDGKTEGVAVLIRSQEAGTHQRIIDTVRRLAKAVSDQPADPIKISRHGQTEVYELGPARLAVFGRWLAVSNKHELLKQVIDNSLAESGTNLASDDPFRRARAHGASPAAAWGYLNLNKLREAGVGRRLSRATMDNPLGELLAGGALSVLQQAPYATAAIQFKSDRLSLQLVSPHDPQWIEERRHYFFGPNSGGTAPPLLAVHDSVLSLTTYRDVSQWWLRAGELFTEKINDELAQADSNLSTLFSGKDFGEDILGSVEPQIQLVVARQQFDAERQPSIKLPAFGLVFRLKDPAGMLSEMRRTFQSLIGFLNVVGSMNGQPQLDLDMDKQPGYQLVMSSYVPEANQDLRRLPINFNFSPTIGFADERFVIASTQELARQLATAGQGHSPSDAEPQNTAALADITSLKTVLSDNRQQLIAQNMLEDGHTRAEAEREIATLLELLEFVRDVSLRFGARDKQLRLSLELKLTAP